MRLVKNLGTDRVLDVKAQGSEFGTVILVVPNPCRLLSRGLLYTALIRHKDRVVLLVQGNPADLRAYAGTELD